MKIIETPVWGSTVRIIKIGPTVAKQSVENWFPIETPAKPQWQGRCNLVSKLTKKQRWLFFINFYPSSTFRCCLVQWRCCAGWQITKQGPCSGLIVGAACCYRHLHTFLSWSHVNAVGTLVEPERLQKWVNIQGDF